MRVGRHVTEHSARVIDPTRPKNFSIRDADGNVLAASDGASVRASLLAAGLLRERSRDEQLGGTPPKPSDAVEALVGKPVLRMLGNEKLDGRDWRKSLGLIEKRRDERNDDDGGRT